MSNDGTKNAGAGSDKCRRKSLFHPSQSSLPVAFLARDVDGVGSSGDGGGYSITLTGEKSALRQRCDLNQNLARSLFSCVGVASWVPIEMRVSLLVCLPSRLPPRPLPLVSLPHSLLDFD